MRSDPSCRTLGSIDVIATSAIARRRKDPMTTEESILDTIPGDPQAARLADMARVGQLAARLVRAGLIVDRTSLSPAHRRAYFALQCQGLAETLKPVAERTTIGFPY